MAILRAHISFRSGLGFASLAGAGAIGRSNLYRRRIGAYLDGSAPRGVRRWCSEVGNAWSGCATDVMLMIIHHEGPAAGISKDDLLFRRFHYIRTRSTIRIIAYFGHSYAIASHPRCGKASTSLRGKYGSQDSPARHLPRGCELAVKFPSERLNIALSASKVAAPLMYTYRKRMRRQSCDDIVKDSLAIWKWLVRDGRRRRTLRTTFGKSNIPSHDREIISYIDFSHHGQCTRSRLGQFLQPPTLHIQAVLQSPIHPRNMARPIDIPEILEYIIYIAAPRPIITQDGPNSIATQIRARDLSEFTLVSRFWNCVATPILWEFLPHQLPLLKLLPSDAWTISSPEHKPSFPPSIPSGVRSVVARVMDFNRSLSSVPKSFRLTRTLQQSDWEAVRRLSKHVKVLWYSCHGCAAGALSAMAASPPKSVLLPRLERLLLVTNYRSDHSFIPLLMSPTVWELQLLSDSGDTFDLREIASRCPNVTHLRLSSCSGPRSSTTEEAITLAGGLAGFTKLTHLSLSTAVDGVGSLLWALDKLRSLTHLRLIDTASALSRAESAEALMPTCRHVPAHPMFRHLRSIRFDTEVCPAAAEAFVKSWGGSRPIETFTMPLGRYDRMSDMSSFIALIASHCSPSTLTHLDVITRSFANYYHPPVMPFDAILPLSLHRALRVVRVGASQGALDFVDSDYEELAQWWPHLTELYIPNVMGRSCTLRSLVAFATHCLQLRKLTLKLDATEIPPVCDGASGDACALAQLQVTDGQMSDPEELAAFLIRIFPRLRSTRYRAEDEEDRLAQFTVISYGLLWKEVEAALPRSASALKEA
ncbi:uncharacterized protein SCHCODRAFT_01188619 [Schizophyllum commune H4-8]|uniref:F-box domain-containing protein n=1 Tax=Schizophyllum commune (strain H4-8 / FGSC 9210) TaxID=578458 RepID=D8PYK2_SCHCM|nr:uncharacterized protein SCHCODRAFT_01188619 [Schizophyllum commune H4-8]KAI5896000.1 hypothetical protein SCHCODRAFT_01188619 [Schizophyllum commune H4-8]